MVYLQINFATIYAMDLIMSQKPTQYEELYLRDIITQEIRRNWPTKETIPYYNKKNKKSYWNVKSHRSIHLIRQWKNFGYRGIATGIIFVHDLKLKRDIPIMKLECNSLIFLKYRIDMNGNMIILDDRIYDIFEYRKEISSGEILKIYKKLKFVWDY